MLLMTLALGVLAADGGALDAGPSVPRAAVERQAAGLAACAPELPGDQEDVSVDWRVVDGGVRWARAVGSATPWGDCVTAAVARFDFPGLASGRATQTFRLGRDGGVEVRAYEGPGGLDKSVIGAVVQAHAAEVRFCYERALQGSAGLEGKVSVWWVIGPDGAVKQATVATDTLPTSDVADCIEGRVKTWRFPEPIGGGKVDVTFPWIFKEAVGQVRTDDIETSAKQAGALDKRDIATVINAHEGDTRACFAKLKGPSADGAKVVVAWVVGDNGHVLSSRVVSATRGAQAVGACLEREVKGWVFPRPVGGGPVSVSFPWVPKLAPAP